MSSSLFKSPDPLFQSPLKFSFWKRSVSHALHLKRTPRVRFSVPAHMDKSHQWHALPSNRPLQWRPSSCSLETKQIEFRSFDWTQLSPPYHERILTSQLSRFLKLPLKFSDFIQTVGLKMCHPSASLQQISKKHPESRVFINHDRECERLFIPAVRDYVRWCEKIGAHTNQTWSFIKYNYLFSWVSKG